MDQDQKLHSRIGRNLAVYDPVLYGVLKAIENDKGVYDDNLPSPDFNNLHSIYDYFVGIFRRVSVRGRKELTSTLNGNKLIINTGLEAEHLKKVECLDEIIVSLSNELDGSGGGYIIHKYIVREGTIFVVFDIVDTSIFEYESCYELETLIGPYYESLDF